ncbi:MAG: type II 3-dehydroquinate dehydratase [Acidimicrobiia bacterium]|nr:type II 3-dehydroquinate dehydratase [Acidimicrobiia bacterium]MBT8193733.1 type II 3-dehydroquinate dehydratase [Acidimicrobiia bacterium]NNF87152.1 type II 3-dehydroquinate dehydratase [Acidimicrobiia bacterium]NNL13325.1 type II 3-dehydroquinate dehydratase [Acidimicrobiia bacterium]NNL70254.1 type II 3-dehydroquinate dehydratase [Acidimicrobiia bacterium]
MNVLVINGPNLNLLGTREPDVYGTTTLAELDALCVAWGTDLELTISTFQSNHEGAIIDRIQAAAGDCDGIVLNAGALTHYSYALYDALVAVGIPTVEVHISDIHAREEWRHKSVIQPACLAQISGDGLDGYRRALEILTEHLS